MACYGLIPYSTPIKYVKSNAIKDYDIWGNPSLTVETTSNAIRYTGEFYDEEAGLYYLRTRYYDPYLGRFTTEDSYWGEDNSPLSLNRYTYTHNDPVNYTDPSGYKEANLSDLALATGADKSDIKWNGKDPKTGKLSATVTVNGVTKTIIVGEHGTYIKDNRIVIDSNVFDNLFKNNNVSIDTTVKDGQITGTRTVSIGNNEYTTELKGGVSNYKDNNAPTQPKQSPKPKENEEFKVLEKKVEIKVEVNESEEDLGNLVTLKANLYILGYTNVYTDYEAARNQFLKDYQDDGNSLKDRFETLGDGEHYSSLVAWTDQALAQSLTNVAGGKALFLESDIDLKPEVQQMISYFDDLYFYAHIAYENNIIKDFEFKALKGFCEEEVDKLRKANSSEEVDDSTFQILCFVGSLIPFVGSIFDVLGDSKTLSEGDLHSEATKKISANMLIISNTIKSSKRFDYKYTVYELYDDDGVKYVGRTRQNIEARQKQHWRADDNKKGLKIREAEFEGKTLKGLSHSEARGIEHLVFENHGGFNNKNLLNKIKPLDINNPKVAKKASSYIDDALKFIKKLK